MKTTGRTIAIAMSNLLSRATTWLPLAVMMSLFSLARGEDCQSTQYWDHVMKQCAPCIEICDPLRQTMKQCYNQCEQYARNSVTCHLNEAPSFDALTTMPPGGETQQPSITTTLIVAMVGVVVGVAVVFGIIGFCFGKWFTTKKQGGRYISAAQPEEVETGRLYPTPNGNNVNGSDSDFGSSYPSQQTLPQEDSIQ